MAAEGPATLGAVLRPLPGFLRAAEQRLRPIVEAGILSFRATDPEGVSALRAVAELLD